ncbi:alginate export family protein [Lysobacter sp. GX 14042]|uniref:alginate export family protein n=1 Tax=Lysobacter sp. GX 14042 TaxID=2907155 RepID=UPI001F21B0EB|nr:alginate export family protein [Lysobacter sp. GX 14042]MCE7033112.1 alginate export family protein [Lysobacter sp. GX 14042]
MQALRVRWSALPLLMLPALALADPGVGALFADGTPILDLRYRHEHVEQDNALHDANANTLRTRLGYRTGSWNGWSALVEVDNVTRLGGTYNDTRNGRNSHALVADPAYSEVNQALLRYSTAHGEVTAGRQRLNLDNQRFVGGVGWRQNEQTYDGVALRLTPTESLGLTWAWLGQVNTVFGPEDGPHANAANRANAEGDSHLLNLRYTLAPQLVATAYQYRLDLGDLAVTPTAPPGTLSSTTTGLRLDGALDRFGYALEYARQGDRGGNPWELDSRYRLVELGYRAGAVQFKAGREVLGGAGGPGNRAFQTPLATKHQFQGWADLFGTTPAGGIDDRYAGAVVPLAGGTLQGWYHDFRAERGGASYGTELDLWYARAIPAVKGLDALLKYARYDSGDRALTVDTRKLWLQLQYAY